MFLRSRSKVRVSPDDGLYRYAQFNDSGRIDDIIASVNDDVDRLLLDAGVISKPIKSRLYPKPQNYHLRDEHRVARDSTDVEIKFSHEAKDEQVFNDVAHAMKKVTDQIGRFQRSFLDLQEKKLEIILMKASMENIKEDRNALQKLIDDTMGVSVRKSVLPGLSKNVNRSKNVKERKKDNLLVSNVDAEDLNMLGYEVQEKLTSEGFGSKKKQTTLSDFLDKHLPLKKDVRKIEGKFGGATASYFLFSRWIFLQFLFALPFILVFAAFHIYILFQQGYTFTDVFFSSRGGYLPMFASYSSFSPIESVAYVGCIIIGTAIFLINSIVKLWRDDLVAKRKSAVEGENFTKTYAKDIFNVWDNTLGTSQEVEDFSGSLTQLLFLKLKDSEFAGRVIEMTQFQLVILYLKRFVGFILFLAIQSSAFALIIYLTISGSAIRDSLAYIPALSGASGLLINLALHFIGAITPALMQAITDFENWNSTFALEIFLFRVYISATFNLLLVILSYFLLADPYFLYEFPIVAKNFRVGIAPSSSLSRCRLDQISSELFSLFVNSVVIKLLLALFNGIIPYISAWFFKKPCVKKDFEVQISIIENVNQAAMCMVLFIFCPVSLIFFPIVLGISVKIERYICEAFYTKSKRMWDLDKAMVIYTFFYFLSFCIVCIPSIVFFLSTKTFPKACDIQDNSVGICLHPVNENGVCEVSSSSSYFIGEGNATLGAGTLICDNANPINKEFLYPQCICYGDLACGAFIYSIDALKPFKDFVFSSSFVLSGFWKYMLDKSYGAWIIAGIFFLRLGLIRNTEKVLKESTVTKLSSLNNHIDILELENHKLERFVGLMKQNSVVVGVASRE